MPHSNLVVWVEAAPEIILDGDGVRLAFRSGGTEFTNRMSRATFRKACECGIRMLDAEQRGSVVPFKASA